MAEVNNMSSKFELADHLIKSLRILKKITHDEKIYVQAKQHLEKTSLKKIEKIVQKNAMNPEHAEKKLHPIFVDITDTVQLFLTEQNTLLDKYHEVLKEFEREEFEHLRFIEKIIEHWYVIARHGHSIITPHILHDLQKEFEEFEHEMHKILGREYKDDKRLANDHTPRVNFTTKIKSEKALLKTIRKLAKKEIKEDKKEDRLKREIERQLQQQSIELNFPYLFTKFLHEEGKIEVIAKKIITDVKREVFDLLEDRDKVVEHLNPVLKIIYQYKEFVNKLTKEYHELVGHNNRLINELHSLIRNDVQNLKSMKNVEKHEEHEFAELLTLLKHESNEGLDGHRNLAS